MYIRRLTASDTRYQAQSFKRSPGRNRVSYDEAKEWPSEKFKARLEAGNGEIYIEPITAMCLSLNSECLEILRIPISLSFSKAPSKMALPASSLALNFSDGHSFASS